MKIREMHPISVKISEKWSEIFGLKFLIGSKTRKNITSLLRESGNFAEKHKEEDFAYRLNTAAAKLMTDRELRITILELTLEDMKKNPNNYEQEAIKKYDKIFGLGIRNE